MNGLTLKKNPSNAQSAAKVSVNPAPWPSTRSSTWKSLPTSAQCAAGPSTSGPT
nr:unnamed protein product [Callosobruchus chinensis]